MLFRMFCGVFAEAFRRLAIPAVIGLVVFTAAVAAIAGFSGGVWTTAACYAAIAYVVVLLLVLVIRSAGAFSRPW